jgi:hypothetical protein
MILIENKFIDHKCFDMNLTLICLPTASSTAVDLDRIKHPRLPRRGGTSGGGQAKVFEG